VAAVGFDPILRPTSEFAGKRFRFIASTADTAVRKASHADAMLAQITATAAKSAIVTHTNGHLNPYAVKSADFASFVGRCFA
jgi:hypothetical protein